MSAHTASAHRAPSSPSDSAATRLLLTSSTRRPLQPLQWTKTVLFLQRLERLQWRTVITSCHRSHCIFLYFDCNPSAENPFLNSVSVQRLKHFHIFIPFILMYIPFFLRNDYGNFLNFAIICLTHNISSVSLSVTCTRYLLNLPSIDISLTAPIWFKCAL